MNIDSAFYIGSSHDINEDYVIHDETSLVLCDGCSSSTLVDVGARLLALAALDINLEKDDSYFYKVLEAIINSNYSYLLKKYNTMFDATLMKVQKVGNKILISVRGDGVIAYKKTNDEIGIIDISYPSNCPFYFSYDLDPIRKNTYIDNNSSNKIITSISNGLIPHSTSSENPLRSTKDEYDIPYYKMIAVFSDGVHSFQDENRKSIPMTEIVNELINFKTYTGRFAQRRLNKFRKDCAARGWTHYDDISMGVINLE